MERGLGDRFRIAGYLDDLPTVLASLDVGVIIVLYNLTDMLLFGAFLAEPRTFGATLRYAWTPRAAAAPLPPAPPPPPPPSES